MFQGFQGTKFKILGRNECHNNNNNKRILVMLFCVHVFSVLYSFVSFQEGKSSRLSLQVLQPGAGDKENLVGGGRQSVTNMKVGVKVG